jgi:hypothetical protein
MQSLKLEHSGVYREKTYQLERRIRETEEKHGYSSGYALK